MPTHELLIVHPTLADPPDHSMLTQELVRRLCDACEDASLKVHACSSRELRNKVARDLRDLTLIVVDPRKGARTSGDRDEFFSRLAAARTLILASAEPAESPWYREQFEVPVDFHAVFDIGFVPQVDKHDRPSVPYHFVFNAPTRSEKEAIARIPPPEGRPIPWALVGRPTASRLALTVQLMEGLAIGGVVYLPGKPDQLAPDGAFWQPTLGKHEKISASGLAAILEETTYYVWASAHDFACYESIQFVTALRTGAVPAKIAGGEGSHGLWHVPGVFTSPQSFCTAAHREGAQALYQRARDFYLSKGLLATHLEKALEHV